MSWHWEVEEDQISRSWEYVTGVQHRIGGKTGFVVSCLFLDLLFLSQRRFQSSKA